MSTTNNPLLPFSPLLVYDSQTTAEISREPSTKYTISQRTSEGTKAETLCIESDKLQEDPGVADIFSTYVGTSLSLGSANKALLEDLKKRNARDIKDIEERIQRTQSSIFGLCQEAASLYCELDRKRDQIKIAQSLQAPIRILPTEVLDIVFEMLIPEFDPEVNARVPLLLCAVCKSWRNVAINNPFLWQDVEINVARNLTTKAVANFEGFVDMFLQRAKKTAINVKIIDVYDHPTVFADNSWRFMNKCAQLFTTCAKLELSITSSLWLDCLIRLGLAGCTFEKLSTISLLLDYWELQRPLAIFQEAPELKDAYLSLPAYTLPLLILPHTQLDFINCAIKFSSQYSAYSELRNWREFLALCENLTQLDVSFETIETLIVHNEGNLVPVVLPDLENLSISTFEILGDVGTVLEGLETPSLEIFSFSPGIICQFKKGPVLDHISPIFFDFTKLAPNFTHLRSLSIRLVSIEDRDMRSFLDMVPQVDYLHIVNFKVDPFLMTDDWVVPDDTKIVRLLRESAYPGAVKLLPKLTHLVLSYPYHETKHPWATHDYIQMLRARCTMNAAAGLRFDNLHSFWFKLEFCTKIIPQAVIESVTADLRAASLDRPRFFFRQKLVREDYTYADT